eukprot:g14712.t1
MFVFLDVFFAVRVWAEGPSLFPCASGWQPTQACTNGQNQGCRQGFQCEVGSCCPMMHHPSLTALERNNAGPDGVWDIFNQFESGTLSAKNANNQDDDSSSSSIGTVPFSTIGNLGIPTNAPNPTTNQQRWRHRSHDIRKYETDTIGASWKDGGDTSSPSPKGTKWELLRDGFHQQRKNSHSSFNVPGYGTWSFDVNVENVDGDVNVNINLGEGVGERPRRGGHHADGAFDASGPLGLHPRRPGVDGTVDVTVERGAANVGEEQQPQEAGNTKQYLNDQMHEQTAERPRRSGIQRDYNGEVNMPSMTDSIDQKHCYDCRTDSTIDQKQKWGRQLRKKKKQQQQQKKKKKKKKKKKQKQNLERRHHGRTGAFLEFNCSPVPNVLIEDAPFDAAACRVSPSQCSCSEFPVLHVTGPLFSHIIV